MARPQDAPASFVVPSYAERLPWRDAHMMLSEHGDGAGEHALQLVADFEDRRDFNAAVRWGRIYLAISHLTSDDWPDAIRHSTGASSPALHHPISLGHA